MYTKIAFKQKTMNVTDKALTVLIFIAKCETVNHV